jgi:hypothetical protein
MNRRTKILLAAMIPLAFFPYCKRKEPDKPARPEPRKPAKPPEPKPRTKPPDRPRPAEPPRVEPRKPRTDPGPLTKEQRKIFWGSPAERAPRKRAREAHFYVGNENELFLFQPYLKDLGGGYAGVGTDQAYLFIGWMRPEFSWLTDYDQAVVDLHWVHHAFFRKARTPHEFVELWSKTSAVEAEKTINERYAKHPRLKWFLRVYRKAQPEVHPRLRKVRRVMRKNGVDSYLTSRKIYRFVVKSIRRKRIRPMVADLRGPTSLKGVGEASRKLGVPVRLFYPSNAEEYWRWFPDGYRKNVLALNFDSKSIVIRTMTRSREKSQYTYHVQPALNFAAWIKLRRIGRIHQFKRRMVKRIRNAELFIADQPPPPGRKWQPR